MVLLLPPGQADGPPRTVVPRCWPPCPARLLRTGVWRSGGTSLGQSCSCRGIQVRRIFCGLRPVSRVATWNESILRPWRYSTRVVAGPRRGGRLVARWRARPRGRAPVRDLRALVPQGGLLLPACRIRRDAQGAALQLPRSPQRRMSGDEGPDPGRVRRLAMRDPRSCDHDEGLPGGRSTGGECWPAVGGGELPVRGRLPHPDELRVGRRPPLA